MVRASPMPRHSWVIWLVTVALMSLLTAACDADGTQEGPGPVGPVGPVDGDEEGIPGSGDITTETRELAEFDRVVFSIDSDSAPA